MSTLLEARQQPLAAGGTAFASIISSLLPKFKRLFIIVRKTTHYPGGGEERDMKEISSMVLE